MSYVTLTSAAPSAFHLSYTDSNNVQKFGHVSPEEDRPGSAGTLIQFSVDVVQPEDQFALNDQKQLTAGGLVAEKNARDPYPYLFLDGESIARTIPRFSVCNGNLLANYPGTQDNRFAVCSDFLSLGRDTVFGASNDSTPCERIELSFLEASDAPVGQ